jgi:Tfp pilus assembly pilus retraction ATPase PilT
VTAASAVFEVMKSTVAIQNMIREDKLHQLNPPCSRPPTACAP